MFYQIDDRMSIRDTFAAFFRRRIGVDNTGPVLEKWCGHYRLMATSEANG
jgi:hypothetical protein